MSCRNGTITSKPRPISRCRLFYNECSTARRISRASTPWGRGGSTCAWNTRNNAWGGGTSASVVTAPNIANQHGRTCTGPHFIVGTQVRQTVAAGLTVDDWNGVDPQTMSNITIGATCAGTATATIPCPNIMVRDPNAMCEYPEYPTICPGVSITQVKTAATGLEIGCYFVTSITQISGSGAGPIDVRVNGEQLNSTAQSDRRGGCGGSLPSCDVSITNAGIERIDGGYYVWIPSLDGQRVSTFTRANTFGGLHPNCQ